MCCMEVEVVHHSISCCGRCTYTASEFASPFSDAIALECEHSAEWKCRMHCTVVLVVIDDSHLLHSQYDRHIGHSTDATLSSGHTRLAVDCNFAPAFVAFSPFAFVAHHTVRAYST